MKLFKKHAQGCGSQIGRLAIGCSLLLLLAGCGKDSDDGDVANTLAIPTDIVLNLYCADVGLHTETCVLDDPDNPYASVPFVTANPDPEAPPGQDFNDAKFALAADVAGNPKATFYVYATAQARSPSGENQWYTARALHELYTATVAAAPPDGSLFIRDHALRAYRSVLDNYFASATFFEANFLPAPPPGGIFFPILLRELTAQDMAMTPGGFTPLFDIADADNNQFIARNTLGGWGYTWVGMVEGGGGGFQIPGPVTKN